MNIWIIGAKGLLAKALFSSFCNKGLATFASSREEADLGDLASLRHFIKGKEVTHIINCSAVTNVDQAEVEKETALRINAEGPAHLACIAKERGARLLHISTDYVFGGKAQESPYREEDSPSPVNFYGQTKLEGEMRIQKILPTACILRTSWLFGMGKSHFVSWVVDCLKQKKPLRVPTDHIGSPTYVPDLCEAIFALIGKSGLYHFSNPKATNRYDYAIAIRDLSGLTGSIESARLIDFPSLAKRPNYSVLDLTKISTIISPRPWREALKDYLHETS